jgi:sortase A
MWRLSTSSGGRDAAQGGTGKGRRPAALVRIERILLVSGLALVVFYSAARLESRLTSRAALKHFAAAQAPAEPGTDREGARASADRPGSSRQPELPPVDFSGWDRRRIKAFEQSGERQWGVPLAVLRIPRIRLEAPLFEGTDEVTLNHAVGRIAGTARPGDRGNIGIAGHRDGFFRGLKDVSVSDRIELTTLRGTDIYVVDEIQIVSPQQVEVLRPTRVPSLTLVTCYPFYFFGSAPERYIVRASLSQEKNGKSGDSGLSAPATQTQSIRRKPMNLFQKARLSGKGAGAIVLATVAVATMAAAQDSTVQTIQHGQPSYETEVRNAEIVYVEGNDLVLKLENGRVEHLVVPDSDRFTIDGREVGVAELVPGTKLTQTITTTTTPRYVNSVRTIEGKVWHVNAPRSVILTLPDHQNQILQVPSHARFTIDGKEKTVFDLKKGMKIKATIVTDEEHTVIEQTRAAYGQTPPINFAPRDVGVLLFAVPKFEPTLASAEQPEAMLPETGSSLPLIGLLGTLAIATAVSLGVVRRNYAS